jgi:hypothetical protein
MVIISSWKDEVGMKMTILLVRSADRSHGRLTPVARSTSQGAGWAGISPPLAKIFTDTSFGPVGKVSL